MIDDYSSSGANSSVTSFESPTLHTVDIAAALPAVWLDESKTKRVDFTLHARTFDLSSAYKQLALSELGRSFSFVSVFDPDRQCSVLFRAKVLPFGATRSESEPPKILTTETHHHASFALNQP